ncbi:prepilin-type N-terminal cleavage/methylation domain protein [Acinetobacter baumannii 1391434]|nr:prepilin-type N-terminal cleavage/methylation domain protein [Acinetobacter baumannii 1391434]
MIKPQQAFTLIELMVALALGLLIVAAGLAVFLSSQRSMGLQSSLEGLQQNANFGLSSLTHDLRHANLNTASSQYVNNKVIGSGIIFAKENLPTNLQNTTDLETKFVSLQNKDTDNTSGKSDQLTIQYVPAANEIIDCEGNSITSAQSKTALLHKPISKGLFHNIIFK